MSSELDKLIANLRMIADDARASFGNLSAEQLNWKPSAERWSVAQCFDHLVTANQLMLQSSESALAGAAGTVWQRVPVLPGIWGRMLIRSQTPGAGRKFTAPPKAQPRDVRVTRGEAQGIAARAK